MAGQVLMVNVSATSPIYILNDSKLGLRSLPMMPPNYTPSIASAMRSKYGDPPGTFAFGDNQLEVQYNDTLPSPTQTYTVNIPTFISVDDSLILYIFRNGVMLMNVRGDLVNIKVQ